LRAGKIKEANEIRQNIERSEIKRAIEIKTCPLCQYENGKHSRECPEYTEPPKPKVLENYEDLTHPITGEKVPF